MINFINKLIYELIDGLGRMFDKNYYLNQRIKRADELHVKTGKQYFVMPIDNNGNSIVVHGASFLTEYNKKCKKTGARQMTYMDMVNMCLYKTAKGATGKRIYKGK